MREYDREQKTSYFVRIATLALLLCTQSYLLGVNSAFSQQRVTPGSKADIVYSYAPVVKKAAPAVVNVYVRRRAVKRVSPFFKDPFFRRFFDGPFGVPRERLQSSLGSGVIVTSDGIVVTNYHVIKGAVGEREQDIKVVLADKREFPATVIVKDERSDLAVLRIKAAGVRFPYLEFGDSDELEVGDLVLAIGNPFGVGQTVTSGIVSALARTRVGISDYQFFIQTDAAINPGNSGGALVNMQGKLVGINTAIFSRSGGSNGIGFAIPSNMSSVIVQTAINGGHVKRPWFGARFQPVNSEIAERLGLDRPAGALVNYIFKAGPAERAGIMLSDVIVGVDGKPVADPRAFRYRFSTKRLGTTVTLSIIRDGRIKKISVLAEGAPENPPKNETWLDRKSPFAGTRVANLSPALSEELLIQDHEGIVVTEIRRNSPAQSLGLRKNDIILRVNDRAVKRVRELNRILSKGSRSWRFVIKRGKHVLSTVIGGRRF